MHRLDSPNAKRPFRCPNWLLATGAILGFVNLAFLGMGANIWGAGTLTVGLLVAAAIIPVFCFRHYVQDKGEFPEQMYKDMMLTHGEDVGTIERRCGMLPYLTLAAAFAVVFIFNSIAVY
jgi:hypothetical protein